MQRGAPASAIWRAGWAPRSSSTARCASAYTSVLARPAARRGRSRARARDLPRRAAGRESTDVYALAQRAVEELRGAHPARQIALAGAPRCMTTGDPERLVQVFSNLIGNALQHGAPGAPVTVEVG